MELLIGILAAWGAVMLVWTILGLLLLPLTRRKDLRITAILRGSGDAGHLEQYIKGLLWLRNMGLVWWDIAILSDDLTDEARDEALRLTETQTNSAVISTAELLDWMER